VLSFQRAKKPGFFFCFSFFSSAPLGFSVTLLLLLLLVDAIVALFSGCLPLSILLTVLEVVGVDVVDVLMASGLGGVIWGWR
jgi:hypothetical protein